VTAEAPPSAKPNWRARLWFVAKIAFSVGTLVFVLSFVSPAKLVELFANFKWLPALLALAIFSAVQVVAAYRTTQVVAALGGHLPLRRSWDLNYVSLWLSQALPSSVGGDVAKGVYLLGQFGARRAAHIVLLDRLTGIAAMLAVIAAFLPGYTAYFQNANYWQFAATILVVLFTPIIATLMIASLNPEKLPAPLRPVQAFAKNATALLRWPFVFSISWTALVIHINGVLAYFLLGQALGIEAPFAAFWLLVPLIYIAALFPLALAGWGIREASAIWLLSLAGVPEEKALALSVAYGLFMIVVALPGCLLLGSVKVRPSAPIAASNSEG